MKKADKPDRASKDGGCAPLHLFLPVGMDAHVARELEALGVRSPAELHHRPTDDSEWFAAHPTRTHRVRATTAQECAASDGATTAIVRQIAPGARVRALLHGPLELLLTAGDDVLSAMVDLLAHADGPMSIFEILAEAQRRASLQGTA